MGLRTSLTATLLSVLVLVTIPVWAADDEEQESVPDRDASETAEKEKIQESAKPPKKRRNRSGRAAQGPDIVLVESEEKTIYAYSQNGRLRAIKVVPKIGKPYYLRPADPTKHFGDIDRADLLLTTWVLLEF